jgi:long-chain fatty acid transport protein
MIIKRSLFIIVIWCIICTGYVFAAGYEGPGLGARGIGMGGAFIGLADEWTAVYWNPAGLAQLEGAGFGLDVSRLYISGQDGDGVPNHKLIFTQDGIISELNEDKGDIFYRPFAGTQPLSNEPEAFSNVTKVVSNVWLPAIGGYKHIGDYCIGYGLYAPAGYKTTWADTEDSVSAEYDIEMGIKVGNISIANWLTHDMALGIGINVINGEIKKHARKDVPNMYTFTLDTKCSGDAIEWVIGMMFDISRAIQIGMVYRSGAEVKLTGETRVSYPVPTGTITPPLEVKHEKSEFTTKYSHPVTWGIGIALNAAENLIITSDWTKTCWSSMKKDIRFDNPGNMLKNTYRELGWTDEVRFRVGMEYKHSPVWTFRCGMLTDPSPVPDKAINLTNIIDVTRTFYTIGVGYNKHNWHIDVMYLHGNNDRIIDNIRYTKETDEYRVKVEYIF